jgi:membrane-bound metal-dependent hydrolase YbcI (DUF457 family)
MPSPIGHALAGATIAWAIAPRAPTSHDPGLRPRPSRSASPGPALLCAGLAAAPDLDLLVSGGHRTLTHSLGAVAIIIVAILVTGKVTRYARLKPRATELDVRIIVAVVLAYASHPVLDWLAADPTPPRGLQILWPFSDRWYISGLDIFRGTARRNIFTARSMRINVMAIGQELAILGPIAWIVRRARR